MRWVLHAVLLATPLGASSAPAGPELTPPRLVSDSPALYPDELRAEGLGGEVSLSLLLDERGAVREVQVVGSGHPLFQKAAVEAARGLHFAPATLGGKGVQVWLSFIYRFQPPPRPAPNGTLWGMARARGSREPIAQAAVSAGAGQVAETDRAGRFLLQLPPGVHSLIVRAPGFEPGVCAAEVRAGERLEVTCPLERVSLPYETVVRGSREAVSSSRTRIEAEELREVPGTMGDPFRVVTLMPGVSVVASGVAFPVVRGSQPAESGYFVDGVRVPLLFHLFLGPSVLHPDLIESIEFQPGAAPARYGRLLGGVIDARVTRPRSGGVKATAYADLINAGGFLQAPLKQTGSEVTLAGRYSYSPWLMSQLTERIQANAQRKLVLSFYDYQGRLEQKLPGGSARVFAFGSSDLASTLRDDDTHAIVFHRADLRYRPRLGSAELEVGATLGLDRLQYLEQAGAQRNSLLEIDSQLAAIRASCSTPVFPGVSLSVGADLEHRLGRRSLRVFFSADPFSSESASSPVAVGTFVGGYAELGARAGGFTFLPGLRVDNYHLVGGFNRVTLEPRLEVRKVVLEGLTLKAAAGLFHQPPSTLLSLPVLDVASLPEGLQRAAHLTLGAEWKLPAAFALDTSFYLNPLLRTIELNPFAGPILDGFQLGGSVQRRLAPPPSREGASHGAAYGVELMLRKQLSDRWFGWISYALQRSERLTPFERYDSYGGIVYTDQAYLPYSLDQAHVLNAVASYRLGKSLTVGAALHYHTGRPETGGLTSETQRRGFDGFASPMWLPVDRDQADRLPPFFRLDARIANRWTWDSWVLDGYLDLFNLTLSREVVAYRYLNDGGQLTKLPEGAVVSMPVLGLKGSY